MVEFIELNAIENHVIYKFIEREMFNALYPSGKFFRMMKN